MNKIVAAAVAAAFIAPLAMADVDLGPVKIYGSLRTAVESISVDGQPGQVIPNGQDSQTRLADEASRFGIKGEWKINDQFKAIGQIESRFYVGESGENKSGTATIGTRNTFIGLEGENFGKLLFGRHDNAYKLFRKAGIEGIDRTLNDSSEIVGKNSVLNRLGDRTGDIVHYATPKLAGFSGMLDYNFGKIAGATSYTTTCKTVSNCTTTATTGTAVNAPQFSANLAYNSQYFDIAAAYTNVSDAYSNLITGKLSPKADVSNPGDDSMEAYTIGASAKYAGVTFSAGWEKTKSNFTVNGVKADQEQDSWGIGAYYKLGDNWQFQAAYNVANEVNQNGKDIAGSDASEFGLAVSYSLIKQISVIGSYTYIDQGKLTNYTSSTGFNFATGSGGSIFALGLRGDF